MKVEIRRGIWDEIDIEIIKNFLEKYAYIVIVLTGMNIIANINSNQWVIVIINTFFFIVTLLMIIAKNKKVRVNKYEK